MPNAVEKVSPGALIQAELHVLIDELQLGLAGVDAAVRESDDEGYGPISLSPTSESPVATHFRAQHNADLNL